MAATIFANNAVVFGAVTNSFSTNSCNKSLKINISARVRCYSSVRFAVSQSFLLYVENRQNSSKMSYLPAWQSPLLLPLDQFAGSPRGVNLFWLRIVSSIHRNPKIKLHRSIQCRNISPRASVATGVPVETSSRISLI